MVLITSSFIAFILIVIPQQYVQGGNCWSTISNNGRCIALLRVNSSQSDCCGSSDSVSTAWSKEDLDASSLFFWRALGGGVPCYPCKDSCVEVQCGEGKKCVVRRDRPKCVCAPDCKTKKLHSGPVCGTDRRTYSTHCRLLKRACRKSSNLSVAYFGHCQKSCDTIKCSSNKQCLVDQNLTPHCVKCSHKCSHGFGASHTVCGIDGVTYRSYCHLKEAACLKGKAIPVAYKGRCKKSATCSSVKCRKKQSCLTEQATGSPRCVTCTARCRKTEVSMGGPLCGTNNITYSSWCHILRDSCTTGYVIETKYPGTC